MRMTTYIREENQKVQKISLTIEVRTIRSSNYNQNKQLGYLFSIVGLHLQLKSPKQPRSEAQLQQTTAIDVNSLA